MANASPVDGGGVTVSGGPGGFDGTATETQGREDGDPEFYQKYVDEKIVKIRPSKTALDTISRYAESRPCDSFEVKYYSMGTRASKTKVKVKVEEQSSGSQVVLQVEDSNIFSIDDSILVQGKKAITDPQGGAYNQDDEATPGLVLYVVGKSENGGHPIVCAINGNKSTEDQDAPFWLPQIEAGTVLVRMGKSAAEGSMQTGKFNNLPTSDVQYCQTFVIQVEETTLNKIAKKEVDWNFSDLEEDAIYDMKKSMELSFLFGAKAKINHPKKEGMASWFTGGIWYMAGRDIEIGTWDAQKKAVQVTDDDLVDITKDMFVGNGTGDGRKVMFAGSDVVSALSKIKSEKFRLKESVEYWGIKFKGFETEFGDVYVLHHELFDEVGMSDKAFSLDPTFLSKRVHLSWTRSELDLRLSGDRDVDAVVLREICCLVLKNPKAHARMHLAKAS